MEIPDYITDHIDVQECQSLRFTMEMLVTISQESTDLEALANLKCHLIALFNILPVCNHILCEHVGARKLEEILNEENSDNFG